MWLSIEEDEVSIRIWRKAQGKSNFGDGRKRLKVMGVEEEEEENWNGIPAE